MINELSNLQSVVSQTNTAKANLAQAAQNELAPQVNAQQSSGSGHRLLDLVELSPETAASVQYSSAQMEIAIHSATAVAGSNGQNLQLTSKHVSLSASFEFLQVLSGNEPVDPFAQQPSNDGSTPTIDKPADPIKVMLDFFSPQKTAERILNHALSYFPKSSHYEHLGNSLEGRNAYSQFIGGAIQQGFDEAQEILGDIPEPIQADVDKTHELVFNGLDDFVKNGLDPEKAAPGGVYDRIQSYTYEMSLSVTQTSVTVSQTDPAPAPDPTSDKQQARKPVETEPAPQTAKNQPFDITG